MKKLFIVCTILCGTQLLSAQKSIVGFKNSLKTSSSSIKGVIPIINENNNDVALFFADAKTFTVIYSTINLNFKTNYYLLKKVENIKF